MRTRASDERIIGLLLEGCDNAEIANQINVTPRTVKAHLRRLALNRGMDGTRRVKLAATLRGGQLDEKVVAALTERQRQVATLVTEGMTNREVGERIGTTEGVVRNYLHAIYDKLGVWNRLELALRCLVLLLLVALPAWPQTNITLTWTQGTANSACTTDCPVTSNNVYRSTVSGSSYQRIYTSTTPITTYNDPLSGLVAGTTYYYVVTAVATCDGNTDCGGVSGQQTESAYSGQTSATYPVAAPANPILIISQLNERIYLP